MRSRTAVVSTFLVGALLAALAFRIAPSDSQTTEPATYVGSESCAECHEKVDHSFRQNGHGRALEDSALVADRVAKVGCESCHGPMSLHVAADGDEEAPGFWEMRRFNKDMPPADANATCTACHSGQAQIHWDESVHADRGLKCVDCHTMHSPQDRSRTALLKADDTNHLCMTCHKSKRMQLSRSAHMPLLEGGMDCASCHDPHGSATPKNLKANSVNELCESCHMDKRGPMLFDHAPVRENCLNCHEPHGANNQRSLAAKTPFLCQRCHVATRHPSTLYDAPDLASNRLFNRSCLNCHSQIHGSNHPSGKYFLR